MLNISLVKFNNNRIKLICLKSFYFFGITVGGARNKVMACLIPYLKIPLNIEDFIFAMLAYFQF